MTLSKEVKTGILVIGAILLLIFGYNFLKGTNIFLSKRIFFVRYPNVEGLAKSAPVTINGLIVGKVENIEFAKERGWLVVKFSLEEDIEFSKKSVARIYSEGLIGGKSLGIFPDYDFHDIAKSGDTLIGETEDSMMATVTKALGPLEEKVNNTLATIDTLLYNINDIVDEPTRKHLRGAIENLNRTLNSISGVSENLNVVLRNNTSKLDHTFTNLDKTAGNLAQLTDSLSLLETGKLARDIQDVVDRMQIIMVDVEQGKGTVGKLLRDDTVYENLEGASRQLEQLLQDLKLNPKRYVHFSLFGKRPKEYTKPDNRDK
ncbi:MAG TPA: MlaD family protein [Flavobacteriaceae bacterium]|nr:MlaD family protein [Flavobacteriaceae bacterium]